MGKFRASKVNVAKICHRGLPPVGKPAGALGGWQWCTCSCPLLRYKDDFYLKNFVK